VPVVVVVLLLSLLVGRICFHHFSLHNLIPDSVVTITTGETNRDTRERKRDR
jgi:hypothetical protein